MRHRKPPAPAAAIDERGYKRFVEEAGRTDSTGRMDRNPDLRAANLDPRFPHFEKAVKNHEMWHQKEVETAYTKSVPFPSKMVCIGHAEEIVYLSDKWEDHADFYSYIHTFDSHPEVYADERVFHGVKAKSTAKLLGVRGTGSRDKLATPILARVAEFTYVDNEGETHIMRFDFPPLMLCSPDTEGLIIASDKMGPIVVRGGQMEITERGIIK